MRRIVVARTAAARLLGEDHAAAEAAAAACRAAGDVAMRGLVDALAALDGRVDDNQIEMEGAR